MLKCHPQAQRVELFNALLRAAIALGDEHESQIVNFAGPRRGLWPAIAFGAGAECARRRACGRCRRAGRCTRPKRSGCGGYPQAVVPVTIKQLHDNVYAALGGVGGVSGAVVGDKDVIVIDA